MNAPEDFVDPVERKAADWVMRDRQGRLSPRQRREYERWRAADPLHAEAVTRAERAWQATAALRGLPGYRKPPRPAPMLEVRGWLQVLSRQPAVFAGACAVLLLGSWLLLAPPLWLQGVTSDYHTGTGETRTIELSDGSRIELGSRSILDVAYDDDWRLIRLLRGEAIFIPAPKAGRESRPFRVETPGAGITALGTRYLVGVTENRAGWLSVLQHRVELELSQDGTDDVGGYMLVEEGSSVAFDPRLGIRPLDDTPQELASWSEGLLVFRRQLLGEVVERLNRHRPGHILVMDGVLRNTPVSAVIRLDDLEQIPHRLARELGARTLELPGITLIY